jgi:hypothetical protein
MVFRGSETTEKCQAVTDSLRIDNIARLQCWPIAYKMHRLFGATRKKSI